MNKFNKKLEALKILISKIANSNNPFFISILGSLLFVISVFWFYGLQSHTLMGDDLVNWNFYKETPHFVDAVIVNHEFGKYRPVFDVFEFSLFKLFSSSMQLFFLFNVAFNFAIVTLIFFLIKKITKNNIFAFCFSLLYLTSRFSYYNLLQITGFLEALSILWLTLIVYVSVLYFTEKNKSWLYWLLILNFFIIFTHERFIVLLPFILAVIYFGPTVFKDIKQKIIIITMAAAPLVLNIFLKKVVFHINFFEGTAGTAIKINLVTVASFFRDGLLNIVGFNIGPEHLSGASFNKIDTFSKSFSSLIFLILIFIVIVSIIKWKRNGGAMLVDQLKKALIWALLFCPLLLSASITIRQEFRWLYAPYVVFLVYFSYIISRNLSNKFKYFVVFIFIFLNLFNNINYRKYIDNIFFVYSQKISDSFYDNSIKKYGCNNRIFIIEKFDSSEWVLPIDLFLKPYICEGSYIKYADNIKNIDVSGINRDATSVYKLNWPKRSMDIVSLP